MAAGHGKAVIKRASLGNFMRIGLIGVGRIGVLHARQVPGWGYQR